MLPRVHDLRRQSPHVHEVLVEARDFAICVRHQNPVGRRFQSRAHHRQRMGEIPGLPLQRLLRLDEIPLRALAREKNAVGVL